MTCKYYTEIGKSLRKFRLYFKGHFSTWTWVTTLSPFWILLEQRMMEVAVNNARPVRSAKLQSICLHQQANIQHFTGRMPFLLPKILYKMHLNIRVVKTINDLSELLEENAVLKLGLCK